MLDLTILIMSPPIDQLDSSTAEIASRIHYMQTSVTGMPLQLCYARWLCRIMRLALPLKAGNE
jgi:hypothetical protein